MFSAFTRHDQIMLRVTLASAWFLLAAGGVFGFFNPAPSLQIEVGDTVSRVSAIVVVAFGFGAGLGVAIGKQWFEWTASWFAAGGVVTYAIAALAVFTHDPARGQTAFYLFALLALILYRGLANGAYAHRQRTIHALVEAERAKQ